MSEPKQCWLLELGVEPYDRVWEMQHRLVEGRREGRIPDVFLLLEHEPVITLGRRGNENNILATPGQLEDMGVMVRKVERGGDVTYHGPGQLVGYPILRIHDHDLGASDYMHALEEVLIRAVGDLGIVAYRRDGLVGVWTERGKVAALGARIQLGVSFHGFALNVDPIMEHWRLIVPCGLTEPVTSMSQLLGRRVEVDEVRARVRVRFAEVFGVSLQPVTWEGIKALVE